MTKIKSLDGLRGLAVWLVLLHHLCAIEGITFIKAITNILSFGYFGVDIFFVLSGFLITRILIAEKKANAYSFQRFYIKRAIRIFPIFYLTIVLVGIFITAKDALPIALYIGNYYLVLTDGTDHPLTHTWTLSVEEHFYLLWPLLIYYVDKAELVVKYILPVIAVISAFLGALYFEGDLHNFIYRSTHHRILGLCFGAALAYHEVTAGSIRRSRLLIMTALALLMIIPSFFIPLPTVYKVVFFSSISGVVFLCVLNGVFSGFFTSSVMTFFGRISYGLYLFHYPIFWLFGIAGIMSWEKPVLAVLTSIAMASISFYLIERPILRLKPQAKMIPPI